MFETIVALATAPMKSALGIIRLSGDECFDVVSKIFTKDLRNLTARTALIGDITYNNKIIDNVVLIAYKGPKSFTGEDSVEIICHGSSLIENEIISACLASGARMATNGEYSSRAFMHNKIDLVQAEAINDLINATTKESKNISMMALDGSTSSLIAPIKVKIADILSLIEVNIDFPEYEDIEVANKDKIIEICNELTTNIDNLIANAEKAILIKDGIKTAIVGKPNVGKSSLLNALVGEDKAIVTNIAGTTRDVVEGDINLDGLILHLLDTAGIHDSNNSIEAIGVEKSKKALNDADLVIVLLNSDEQLTKEDEQILELTKDKKRIIVYNKSDLINKFEKDKIYISAANNDITNLKVEIKKIMGICDENFKIPALNNTRQIGLLEQTRNHLLKANEDAKNDLPVDLIAVSLTSAYKCVQEILGEENQSDFSKEIFARFCVGK